MRSRVARCARADGIRRLRRPRRLDDNRREGRRGDIHLSSTERLPTPGEQLLWRQPVAARDVADQCAVLDALCDDRRFLISRPGAPPTRTGEDLESPNRSRVVGLVITL